MPAVLSPDPPLWERYTRGRGRVHLTGLQALVRLVLEQLRRDERAGRRIGALFSGYPGSPLAGFDGLLRSLAPLLERHHVRFVPGLNEELAATAVGGTQLLEVFPRGAWDGALGVFFAKAPGLDRALDALRHASFVGAARLGGALAVVGDDPFCKSSSLPSHSEHAFAHAFVPLFAPADPADVLRLGLAAFALSRYAGLWTGMRVVADVADAGQIFELPEHEPELARPEFEVAGAPFAPRFDPALLPPNVLRIEQELVFGRMEAVRRFAAANGLNPILSRHPRDKLGLVAAGALYRELERALALLDLDEKARERLGIRLLKVDLVWPLEAGRVREFAQGLQEIVVVDTRRGYLEEQVCAALYGGESRPGVLGQRGPGGEPWLARRSEVSGATLAADLAPHLAARLRAPGITAALESLEAANARAELAPAPTRAPHFCSGCPHSSSTRLPEGSLAGGGIGCHTMALLMPEREVRFIGAMGCEGAQWIGLAPWTATRHLFQNLGDGTYFHSGRLAVRACVAAGVPITFKLLWNGVVAMTGGQRAIGAKSLPGLVRDLLADGVRTVGLMTHEPEIAELALRDPRVRRLEREDWDAAMRELREQPGVTALVWDELCANEKQRLERRGLRARPTERLAINEDVCEGCGDCGVKSSCVSLRPVETTLGRKTRLHESSCSDDRACLAGDCPAFISIETPRRTREPFESRLAGPLPEPPALDWDGRRLEILLVGIGSTGVVTIDALLVRAAEHDGLFAAHLDQTGLAQRGGKVVSHCVLSAEPIEGSARVEPGRADVLLAFDPLGAGDREALRALDPGRTHAVAHALYVPTGADVSNPRFREPALDDLLAPLAGVTRSLAAVPAEQLADAALGQPLCANLVLLGYAWQRGLVPLSARALERAIRDNGVAVETNLRAFALGRAAAAEPALTAQLCADATPPAIGDEESLERAERLLGAGFAAVQEALGRFSDSKHSAGLLRRVAGFAADLVDYQGKRLALRYCARIAAVADAEARVESESAELTEVAARELYRVLAYKDEYEVARLLLRGPHRRWLRRQSAQDPRLRYHLHPPLLRALGLRRKLALGADAEPLLHGLVALRGLRGTVFDPFGWTRARRLERELARWYEGVLDALCGALSAESRAEAIAIAGLTGEIRGFESIKEERAARVRPVVEGRLEAMRARR
ncbi:MAG TPA: indolepyruvate ferredoxin oxidoreductase family protein [Myxococcota bacterium]|nr:indolepyruvate ferredoxin oxidoreductase family protein [Myxococcota bacterium]